MMNERIKELKKQAWDYATAVHDGHIVPPLDKEVWPIDKVLDEKFAELIVKECAEFANEHNSEEEGVTLGVGKAIKQHFGVEE
jgi:hypothetical protein